MSESLSLSIQLHPDELERISAEVQGLSLREGWDESLTYRVDLVLEELSLNVINYGFKNDRGPDKRLEITLISEDDFLKIEMVDNGLPFDPTAEAPDPNTDAEMEDRGIGGLGVHLVKTMMDEMHYRREDGKNYLSLKTSRSK